MEYVHVHTEPLIECEGNLMDDQAIFDCPGLGDVENVTNIQCSIDGGAPEDCKDSVY